MGRCAFPISFMELEKYGAMVAFFKWLYEKGIFHRCMVNLKLKFQNIVHLQIDKW